MVKSSRLGNCRWLSAGALVALVLTMSTIFPLSQTSVLANGATRELVKNQRVGPYELQVGILPGIPKVGNLHLSILVTVAESGTPVTDAIVSVAAQGPEGSTNIGPVPAPNTPQSPQFYDVDLPLDTEGSWAVTLEIDAAQGVVVLDVPLEVTSGGAISLALVAAVAIAFLAASIWAWDRIKGRRRRNSRKA